MEFPVRFSPRLLAAFVLLLAGSAGNFCQAYPDAAAPWTNYQEHAAPFFAKYCQECHTKNDPKAEIKFDVITDAAALNSHLVELEKTTRMLNFKLMPPKDSPQPSEAERKEMIVWLRQFFQDHNNSLPRNPGRVTSRRLNRTEYNNTIRDLLGIQFDTTATFPEDNSGYGFDNNGDVLSVAPVLMEKYLEMAELVLDRALFVEPIVPAPLQVHNALTLEGSIPKPDIASPNVSLQIGTNAVAIPENSPAGSPPAPPADAQPANAAPAADGSPAAGAAPARGGRRGRTLPNGRQFPFSGDISFEQELAADGTYVIRFQGYKIGGRAQVALTIDGEKVPDNVTVIEDQRNTGYYAFKPRFIAAGKHRFSIVLLNGKSREQFDAEQLAAVAAVKPVEQAPANPAAENAPAQPAAGAEPAAPPQAGGARAGAGRRGGGGGGGGQQSTLGILIIEVEGPQEPPLARMPLSFNQVIAKLPATGISKKEAAEASIRRFAERAYRRPLTDREMTRLMTRWESADQAGDDFVHSVHYTLQGVLTSPHFLFRVEGESDSPDGIYQLNEFELATRLSYYLWSTLPDEQLFDAARAGTLRRDLDGHIRRMLSSPKSEALVTNFAGQWLQLKGLYSNSPNDKVFPDWDESLRRAMVRETELCFAEVLRNGRSLLDFLDADYTFLNERLALHYGIDGVQGAEFRKVQLADNRRGGLLTQASFLTLTSYPDRTSPVKRGKWVLETLLATPPPDPPPGIPALAEQPLLKGTLRQKLEQHRENPNCAACHALMDPIGFGLENFNAIGQWRERDGADAIEPAGTLPTGESFDGPAQLRQALLKQSPQLTRCLTEQMLTYAMGRGLERTDNVFVEEISTVVAKSGYRVDTLISEIVKSDPFQKRSAKRGVE